MSPSGKHDHFEQPDLIQICVFCGLKRREAEDIIREMHQQIEN